MKTCARCQTSFDNWYLYRDHQKDNGCLKVIRPERTTDRLTGISNALSMEGTIVGDAERTWLKSALIESEVKPNEKRVPIQPDDSYKNFLKNLGKELAKSGVKQ